MTTTMPSDYEFVLSVRPKLSRVVVAGDAVGLRPHQLLHAGPPLKDPTKPPPVLMSSAVMTAIHERWANNELAAENLIRDGTIELLPAQDHHCVTPLAATISQNTPLFEVTDTELTQLPVYSPVSPTGGVDTRMGNRDHAVLERLEVRDRNLLPSWAQWLSRYGPLPVWPMAIAGMAGGDDLHFRTNSATTALSQALQANGPLSWAGQIDESPTYFLTIWMAACALMLNAVDALNHPNIVVRAGGNGLQFGVSAAADREQWHVTSSSPPIGQRFPGKEASMACGAIGDSAVIDILGFGGQRIHLTPDARESFADAGALPEDYAGLADLLYAVNHTGLNPTRPVFLDANRVNAENTAPLIALAMLGADGSSGLLGRGLYRPPVALFSGLLEN